MDHIETAILNCYGIREAEQNMVFAARLTQHGHTIQSMADLMDLYHQSYSQKTVENIAGLPHPTVQKFMVITVAVVGASRRFLAQITRHQNEVKYMSASLQYSNYSGHAAFAIPYGIMKADKEIQDIYKKSCQSDLDHYTELCALGIDHDSAGYATPQGLRNVLIISATPYQWKHMIGQRTCRRNTDETRIVMLELMISIISSFSGSLSSCSKTSKASFSVWIVSSFVCCWKIAVIVSSFSSRFTFLIGSFPPFSFSVLVSSVYSAPSRFFLRLYFFRYPLSYWIPEDFPHLDVFLPSTFPHD